MSPAKPESKTAAAIAPLFVPATRPRLIAKARAAGADAVIADLEDAIAPTDRADARRSLADYLDTEDSGNDGAPLLLRVNNDPDHLADDLALAARYPSIAALVVPKVEDTAVVARAAALGRPVWPLIESPAGLFALGDIAAAPRVERLAFGGLDFAQEAGADPTSEGGRSLLDHVAFQLVLRSSAAELAAPIHGPHTAFKDTATLRRIAVRAHGMGFGGMLCIHPGQIEPVQTAFLPDERQRAWARRVVDAAQSHDGAFQLDGEMIDAPILARAERILRAVSGGG